MYKSNIIIFSLIIISTPCFALTMALESTVLERISIGGEKSNNTASLELNLRDKTCQISDYQDFGYTKIKNTWIFGGSKLYFSSTTTNYFTPKERNQAELKLQVNSYPDIKNGTILKNFEELKNNFSKLNLDKCTNDKLDGSFNTIFNFK